MKQRSIRLIQDFNLDRNSGVNCTMIMRVLLMNISIVLRSICRSIQSPFIIMFKYWREGERQVK